MLDDKDIIIQMQCKQLALLHELDRVCKMHDLHYCLSSGTCLGALRHQGFIPWDDDIDVYMSWQDAEKLAKYQSDFADNYFVQSYKTDPQFKSTHYRLCDSLTSCFDQETLGLDVNHGIFIDIYVYYPYPDSSIVAHKVMIDSFVYRILVAGEGPRNHGAVARFLGEIIVKILPSKAKKNAISKIEDEYRNNGGKRFVATYFGRDVTFTKSIVYPKEWFDEPVYLQFEDMMVPCPQDVHAYCKLQYGDTYMQLPPEDKRKPHHDFVFFSADTPYSEYKGKYY